jgi:hypothetical protein
MQAIQEFFSRIFSSVFNRAIYSAQSTAENKIRETMEQQYDRTFTPKEKGGGNRNV